MSELLFLSNSILLSINEIKSLNKGLSPIKTISSYLLTISEFQVINAKFEQNSLNSFKFIPKFSKLFIFVKSVFSFKSHNNESQIINTSTKLKLFTSLIEMFLNLDNPSPNLVLKYLIFCCIEFELIKSNCFLLLGRQSL